jgi:peptide/nickel transport system substrate-binding protein
MKRVLSIVLVLVMMLSLVACADSGSTSSTTSTTESKTESTPTSSTTESTGGEVLNQIITGSTTELSGDLGNAWWTNNAADAEVREMINDYGVITTDQGGAFVTNASVAESVESVLNEDGTKTYTVKICEDLTYNDGTPITAADYVAYALVAYSPAAAAAGAKTQSGASTVVGATAYQNGEATTIAGIRMLDEYTYSITVTEEYAVYYYGITYASLSPLPLDMWASAELTVADDGEGVYLTGGELVAEEIDAARWIYENRKSAGPYTLVELDEATKTATLKINEYYKGNFEGQKPSVETIIYIKLVQETQFDALKTGGVDFISGLVDGSEINTALDLEETGEYTTVSYERNGYGKIQFQCDFGPTQFTAVRHAVAYLLNRNDFADQFCQGYGSVVHGPYGLAMWMYQDAKEDLAAGLNEYSYSVDTAIKVLEEDGWTLDKDGNAYTTGIRYKEVTAEEAGDYKHNVTLADGRILMPLIIEWSSSEGNSVSDLLVTMLANGEQTATAGMQINQTVMSFDELLNYMYRDATQGDQYGVPTYGMYNLATNFSAQYDLSYNFTMDPELVALGYNTNYTNNELLDQLSMDMVYGVEEGDDEAYLEKWTAFILEWNAYLPEIPLYSNVYYDCMNAKIQGLECSSLWSFPQAVLYATVG